MAKILCFWIVLVNYNKRGLSGSTLTMRLISCSTIRTSFELACRLVCLEILKIMNKIETTVETQQVLSGNMMIAAFNSYPAQKQDLVIKASLFMLLFWNSSNFQQFQTFNVAGKVRAQQDSNNGISFGLSFLSKQIRNYKKQKTHRFNQGLLQLIITATDRPKSKQQPICYKQCYLCKKKRVHSQRHVLTFFESADFFAFPDAFIIQMKTKSGVLMNPSNKQIRGSYTR